jgi:hypothetical protein
MFDTYGIGHFISKLQGASPLAIHITPHSWLNLMALPAGADIIAHFLMRQFEIHLTE